MRITGFMLASLIGVLHSGFPAGAGATETRAIRAHVIAPGSAQTSIGPASQARLRGTVGQPSVQRSASSKYRLSGGFWHAGKVAAGGRIFSDGFEGG